MLTLQVPSLFINFAVLVLSLLLAGVLWYDHLLIISFELSSYLLTLCNKETDMGVSAQHGLEVFGTVTSRLTKLWHSCQFQKGCLAHRIDVLNTAKRMKWQCPCYIALKILLNQLLLLSIIHGNLISLSYMPKGCSRCPKVHDGSRRKNWASWIESRGSSASWIHSWRGSHKVEFDFHGLKL